MRAYVSTGGLGDALIVLAKILQIKDSGYWCHGTSHDVHIQEVKNIQNLIPNLMTECITISRKTSEQFHKDKEKFAEKNGMEYTHLNTKIIEMKYPFLSYPLIKPMPIANICIQMTAGRLDDNTRRSVGMDVVHEILALKSEPIVALIGPEEIRIPSHPRLKNITGMTPSILDTFAIIGGSDFFIGQDGVCAYYAAFLKIPCIINYHIPTLIDHYWHPQWKHVQNLFDGQLLHSHGRKSL